jgi:hypothetical protein
MQSSAGSEQQISPSNRENMNENMQNREPDRVFPSKCNDEFLRLQQGEKSVISEAKVFITFSSSEDRELSNNYFTFSFWGLLSLLSYIQK